jgi:cellulose synthase/poly-beta-1,6-N-acetylglucosamine synthase-like glycosyltransferase
VPGTSPDAARAQLPLVRGLNVNAQSTGLSTLLALARPDQPVKPGRHRGPDAAPAVAPPLPAPGPGIDDRGPSPAMNYGEPGTLTDLRRLSDGMVLEISAAGPLLADVDRPRRRLRRSTFASALRPRHRVMIALLSLCWLACLADFWAWWLEPEHRAASPFGLALNSAVLAYVSCFPVFFVLASNRLRKVNPAVSIPLLRVAFVVTRAPSEPWEMAQSTLSAMLAQDFPFDYDVWLCDEQPTEEIFDWCVSHGAKLSTRSGIQRYHRETWPRRTRCKEGNLAFFYDRWGYHYYDVVAQLDCDHKPSPTYLAEMLRPFSDPAIGYVAAPSVCDANAAGSWSARGRLHKEATFHGPLQLGHSDGLAPACIGSHYAVRTRALRDIGGLGPDLAEDFSTTFLLNAAGWHGAFAIDAEAHGEGPNTFAAMLVQEFQWSRSLTTVLLGLVPRYLQILPWRLRMRFLYATLFYVLVASTTFIGVMLAPAAAVTGMPWIKVNYLTFLLHWWSISACLWLITLLLRRRGMLRPPDAPLVSWENWLYALSRWPYIAWGVCAAVLHRLRPRQLTFKVTPKVAGELEPLAARIMMPYFVISLVSSSGAIVGELFTNAVGYVFLSLFGAATYALVATVVPVLHAREAAAGASIPFTTAVRATVRGPLVLAALAFVPVCVAAALYPVYVIHVFGTMHFGIPGLGAHAFGW